MNQRHGRRRERGECYVSLSFMNNAVAQSGPPLGQPPRGTLTLDLAHQTTGSGPSLIGAHNTTTRTICVADELGAELADLGARKINKRRMDEFLSELPPLRRTFPNQKLWSAPSEGRRPT